MGVSNTAKNTALTEIIAGAYLSLHSTNPGATGLNEISGIVRVAHDYDTPSGGSTDLVSVVDFTVPVGGVVAGWGLWDSGSGGNFLLGSDTTGGSFPGGGTYRLGSAQISVT